jgi:hypothetical protein
MALMMTKTKRWRMLKAQITTGIDDHREAVGALVLTLPVEIFVKRVNNLEKQEPTVVERR